jgi:hypothetical protein
LADFTTTTPELKFSVHKRAATTMPAPATARLRGPRAIERIRAPHVRIEFLLPDASGTTAETCETFRRGGVREQKGKCGFLLVERMPLTINDLAVLYEIPLVGGQN